MKNWIGSILYLIIIILVLEVIKTLVVKAGGTASFLTGIVLVSVQMFILTGFVLFSIIFLLSKKRITPPRKAAVLALVLSLVILTCLEGLFTIGLYHPQRIPAFLNNAYEYYYNTYDRKIIQFDSQASVYDPELFYTLKPNARFKFVNPEFNNTFSTNRLGVRDDESSLSKPAIIGIGDSFGMGWGVEQDSTYCQQLELLSHQKVLNAAISSYGTAREISSLRRFDTTAVTLLVVQYSGNDVIENDDYIKKNHLLVVSSRKLYDKTVRSEKTTKTYFPCRHFLNISQIYIKQLINKMWPVFNFESPNRGPHLTSTAQAELFLKVLSDASINFARCKVIVLYPDKNLDKSHAFEMAVESKVKEPFYCERFGNRLRVLKVSSILHTEDFYLLDDHMKNSGHRKIAEGLWKMMQAF